MKKIGSLYDKYGTIVVLLVLVLIVTSINPKFMTMYNILNVFRQVSINGLIAFGMTFVILTAGIDLSVGAILGLTGMILGLMITSGTPDFIAIVAVLLMGALLGLFNGVLISKIKLQAFIVTLATMTAFRGITMIISDGIPAMNVTSNAPILDFFSQGSVLGIPFPMILFIASFLILLVLLQNTSFGRGVYAIGGNEEVARLSSIPTDRIKTMVYVISGFMSSLAGVILTSRLSSSQPTAGMTFELDAIAAVVIGGTSLLGGRGRLFGTFIGVLIIGVLNNGLNIIGVSAFYQQFIKGVVILLAVILDRKNSQ
ncbi:ABC transporter permease [Pseudogracilibacillus auburnensis]|uniref:Ribose ABC transporter membrane protein n=1 Tax=Pseudogracilibacillus auburnensis TaxID=1494959 RepID=A0A2V3W795_9BACI|nr:ribose ABC transporter permease [Pseudogracilibacillus auburnensis]PXW90243.1 ribose ABC transporter membrane protein [Pseudogracilibacillus auburnensis]